MTSFMALQFFVFTYRADKVTMLSDSLIVEEMSMWDPGFETIRSPEASIEVEFPEMVNWRLFFYSSNAQE